MAHFGKKGSEGFNPVQQTSYNCLKVLPDLTLYPNLSTTECWKYNGNDFKSSSANYTSYILPVEIPVGASCIAQLSQHSTTSTAVKSGLMFHDFVMKSVWNPCGSSYAMKNPDNDPLYLSFPDRTSFTKKLPKKKGKRSKKGSSRKKGKGFLETEAEEEGDDDYAQSQEGFGGDDGEDDEEDEYVYQGFYFFTEPKKRPDGSGGFLPNEIERDEDGKPTNIRVQRKFTIWYEILLKDTALGQEMNERIAFKIETREMHTFFDDLLYTDPHEECPISLMFDFTPDKIAGIRVHVVGHDPFWSLRTCMEIQIQKNNTSILKAQPTKLSHLQQKATPMGKLQANQQKKINGSIGEDNTINLPNSDFTIVSVAKLIGIMNDYRKSLIGETVILIDSNTSNFPNWTGQGGTKATNLIDINMPDMNRYPLNETEIILILQARGVNRAQTVNYIETIPRFWQALNGMSLQDEIHHFNSPCPALMWTTLFQETLQGMYCAFPFWLGQNLLSSSGLPDTYSGLYNLRTLSPEALEKLTINPNLKTFEGHKLDMLQPHEKVGLEYQETFKQFWDNKALLENPEESVDFLKLKTKEIITRLLSLTRNTDSMSVAASVKHVLEFLESMQTRGESPFVPGPTFEGQDPVTDSKFGRLFCLLETDIYKTQIEVLNIIDSALGIFAVNMVHRNDRIWFMINCMVYLGMTATGKSVTMNTAAQALPKDSFDNELDITENALYYKTMDQDIRTLLIHEAPEHFLTGKGKDGSNKVNQYKTAMTEGGVSKTSAQAIKDVGVVTVKIDALTRNCLIICSNDPVNYHDSLTNPLLARYEFGALSSMYMRPNTLKDIKSNSTSMSADLCHSNLELLRKMSYIASFILMAETVRLIPLTDVTFLKTFVATMKKKKVLSTIGNMDDRVQARLATKYKVKQALSTAHFLMRSPYSPWCILIPPEYDEVPEREGYVIEYKTGGKPAYYAKKFSMGDLLSQARYLGTPSIANAVDVIATFTLKNLITIKSGVEMALEMLGLSADTIRSYVRFVDQKRVALATLNLAVWEDFSLVKNNRIVRGPPALYHARSYLVDPGCDDLFYSGFHHLPSHLNPRTQHYKQIVDYPLILPRDESSMKKVDAIAKIANEMNRMQERNAEITNPNSQLSDEQRHELQSMLIKNQSLWTQMENAKKCNFRVRLHPNDDRGVLQGEEFNNTPAIMEKFRENSTKHGPDWLHDPNLVPPSEPTPFQLHERQKGIEIWQVPSQYNLTKGKQPLLPFLHYKDNNGDLFWDPNEIVLTMKDSEFGAGMFTKLIAEVVRINGEKGSTEKCSDASFLFKLFQDTKMLLPRHPLMKEPDIPNTPEKLGALFHPDYIRSLNQEMVPVCRIIKDGDPLYPTDLFPKRCMTGDLKTSQEGNGGMTPRHMQDSPADNFPTPEMMVDGYYSSLAGPDFDPMTMAFGRRPVEPDQPEAQPTPVPNKVNQKKIPEMFNPDYKPHNDQSLNHQQNQNTPYPRGGNRMDFNNGNGNGFQQKPHHEKNVIFLVFNTSFWLASPEGIVSKLVNSMLPEKTLYRPNIPTGIPHPLNPVLFIDIPIGTRGTQYTAHQNTRDEQGFAKPAPKVNPQLYKLRMATLMKNKNEALARTAHIKANNIVSTDEDPELHFTKQYNDLIGVKHTKNWKFEIGQTNANEFIEKHQDHPVVVVSSIPGILISEQIDETFEE